MINRTTTSEVGYGVSVQGTVTESLFGRENFFLVGAAFDFADTAFASDSEIGGLTADRTVSPAGIFIGAFGEGPGDEFSTDLIAKNHYDGVYFSNTLSLTERVHVTLAGRFNLARIEIVDMFGTDLDGDHAFSRFNLAVGATYELADSVTTYASYNESNRSPTAAELSCADPTEPCRVPNAFLSDPPLEQVVSRAIEIGARGSVTGPENRPAINWSVAGFGSRTSSDIIFVASPDLVGAGFFQNAGATERSGVEVDLTGLHGRLRVVRQLFPGPGDIRVGPDSATRQVGQRCGQRRGRADRRPRRPHARRSASQRETRRHVSRRRRVGHCSRSGSRGQPDPARRRGQRSGAARGVRHRQPAVELPDQ